MERPCAARALLLVVVGSGGVGTQRTTRCRRDSQGCTKGVCETRSADAARGGKEAGSWRAGACGCDAWGARRAAARAGRAGARPEAGGGGRTREGRKEAQALVNARYALRCNNTTNSATVSG